jgi:hypothetical protein
MKAHGVIRRTVAVRGRRSAFASNVASHEFRALGSADYIENFDEESKHDMQNA